MEDHRVPVWLSDEERKLIVLSLQRSLDNADYALMNIHPAHPRRGVVTLERETMIALIARLGGEDQSALQ